MRREQQGRPETGSFYIWARDTYNRNYLDNIVSSVKRSLKNALSTNVSIFMESILCLEAKTFHGKYVFSKYLKLATLKRNLISLSFNTPDLRHILLSPRFTIWLKRYTT